MRMNTITNINSILRISETQLISHYHYLSAEVYEVGIRIIDGEHDAVADIKTVKSHTLILLTNVSVWCKWFRLYLC